VIVEVCASGALKRESIRRDLAGDSLAGPGSFSGLPALSLEPSNQTRASGLPGVVEGLSPALRRPGQPEAVEDPEGEGDRRGAGDDNPADRRGSIPHLFMGQMLDTARGKMAKPLITLALPSGIEPLSPP
jgi:hypothetical protein